MEYRTISWKETYIRASDLDAVESLLKEHGWIALPTPLVQEGVGKVYLIQPRPEPYDAQESISVLYKLAAYMLEPCSIILSRNEMNWLHIVYDGEGHYREYITPCFQYTLTDDDLRTAEIISISAIQVSCWKCGGLCESTFEIESEYIKSTRDVPFIMMSQDGFPVKCLRCGQVQDLPKNAFRIV